MKFEEELTVEEILERLKAEGIPVGGWQNTEPDGEVEITTIPTFERQALALEKLKALLQDRIDKDQNQIGELNLKLSRLKHGGGR